MSHSSGHLTSRPLSHSLTTWQSFTIDVNLAQTCRQWSRFFDHKRRFVFNHLVQNVLIYLFIAHIIPDGFINTMILYGLKPPNHISWLNQIIWFLCFHDKKQPDWIKIIPSSQICSSMTSSCAPSPNSFPHCPQSPGSIITNFLPSLCSLWLYLWTCYVICLVNLWLHLSSKPYLPQPQYLLTWT